ncbi:MAG TPA: hypothetical protein VMN39_01050 [Longimicrobiaceae bacterium]|nr:hypothetical protein [Longimicrobiaceae bacterium]
MIDQVRKLAERLERDGEPREPEPARLAPLWLAASQLLLATGAGATLEQISSQRSGHPPTGLAWAPLLVAPLAAAAHLQHARQPTNHSELAVRFLTGASIGFGAALFAFDSIVNRNHPPRRIGPLAFASAGLLGLLLEREERAIEETERELARRARIVERLVPRRKAKLDRVVVHV